MKLFQTSFLILFVGVINYSCGTESTSTYSLSTSVNGSGTITPSSGEFEEGESVTLTATPFEGWVFESWDGDISSSSNPYTFAVNEDKNVVGIFIKESIFLNENGITIMCPNGVVGEKGVVDGIEYEIVDNELLRQRRDEGKDLTRLCVSLVTDMRNLFQGEFDIGDGIITTPSTFNQPIGNWDVSSVTHMDAMFGVSEFNQPLRYWDVSSVESMNSMFTYSKFNQPIGEWDVSSVKNMNLLFEVSEFNQNIENWNVENVESMGLMFSSSKFNQPIGEWDVKNVKEMGGMFFRSSFNQNISGWCVSQIQSEPNAFSTDSPLTEENKPVWGTCPDN